MAGQPHPEEDRLLRRVARERAARKEAERLLEAKARDLYDTNTALKALTKQLEEQVQARTLELRQALHRVESASKAKDAFLALVSHEIRTPMNSVLGLVQLLEFSRLVPQQREQLALIRSSSEHLLELINSILDFSKIEAGQLVLSLGEFDPSAELRKVLEMVRPAIELKGLALEAAIAPDTPRVLRGDAMRLRQIVANLLSNALKFTAQGTIRLEAGFAAQADGTVRMDCAVTDSGIGIAADQFHRLFRDFSQVHDAAMHRQGGTGLGLAICKRLCQAMGGDIAVESVEHQGSTFRFWVRLERAAAAVEAAARGDDEAGAQPPVHHLRVLVVDDLPVNRLVALGLLRRLDIRADQAANGQQALERMASQAYDVVLMDVQMPVLDGLEAARRIRAMDLASQPYIIALTANAYDHDRRRCLDAGMDEFLSKPFRLAELRRQLAEAAGTR